MGQLTQLSLSRYITNTAFLVLRTDGKRPDGLTLIPWQGGKCLTWDVTVVDTLAKSHLPTSAQAQGGVAEAAALLKETKYTPLTNNYAFVPIAFETLGPINSSGRLLISELGRRISALTGEVRESSFLFQRLSVLVQRFNAVCFRGTFVLSPDSDS
jgi:hypothetical protein